jgi:Zn-dependent protease
MENLMDLKIYQILIAFIPLVLAITIQASAQALMAKRYGDTSAAMQGRATLDPMKHIDLIGTIIAPTLVFASTGFIIGWAKPLSINYNNLRNPRKDGIKVCLSGPIANLLMAVTWSILLGIVFFITQTTIPAISQMPIMDGLLNIAIYGVSLNVFFSLFSLIPIPPLEGGKALRLALAPKYSEQFNFLEQYGMFIVLGLAMLGLLAAIIRPIAVFVEGFIMLIPALFIMLSTMV